jgi:hypothetical protein
MKLIWSESKMPVYGTSKLANLLNLLGTGRWCMGEHFDYFIEPVGTGIGIAYVLDQTAPESNGFDVVRRAGSDNAEVLEQLAQQWEDEPE